MALSDLINISTPFAPSPFCPREIGVKVLFHTTERPNHRAFAELVLRWASTVRLVKYIGPIEKIEVFLKEHNAILRVTMFVPDVTGDQMVSVYSENSILYEASDVDAGFLSRMLRHTIWTAARHELDECLTIDGDRTFDPHK
jgi:hypothetical protein